MLEIKVIAKMDTFGDIILFFPGESANFGKIVCWQEIGEHGEADLQYFWECKKPKKENEIIEAERVVKLYEKQYNTCIDKNFILKEMYRLSYKDKIEAWK